MSDPLSLAIKTPPMANTAMTTNVPDADDDLEDDVEDDVPLIESHEFVDSLWSQATNEEKSQLQKAQEKWVQEQSNAKPTNVKMTEPVNPAVDTKTSSSGRSPEVPSLLSPGRECSNLLCPTPRASQKLSACVRCRQAFYCSKECQTQDWGKQHKKECKILMQKLLESDVPTTSTAHSDTATGARAGEASNPHRASYPEQLAAESTGASGAHVEPKSSTSTASSSSSSSSAPHENLMSPEQKAKKRKQELKQKLKAQKMVRDLHHQERKIQNSSSKTQSDLTGRYMETRNNITQLIQSSKKDADIGEGLKSQTGNMSKLFKTLMKPEQLQAIAAQLPANMKGEHKDLVDKMLGTGETKPAGASEKPVKINKKYRKAAKKAVETAGTRDTIRSESSSSDSSRIAPPPEDDQ